MTKSIGSGADSGFTLIEALVVLAIAALAFAMAPLAINLGRTSLSIAADLESSASAQRALASLSDRIASARPIFQTRASGLAALSFSGTADQLHFIAEFADGPAGGGLYTVDMNLDSSKSNLLILLTPHGGYTETTYAPQIIPLLPAERLSLRYFGPNPQTDTLGWQTDWINMTRLPKIVEFSVSPLGNIGTLPTMSIALRLAP